MEAGDAGVEFTGPGFWSDDDAGRASTDVSDALPATEFEALRDHLLEHSVRARRLHPQVRPQEQLVHRLEADGVPARGHGAGGRRRPVGDPRRGRRPSAGLTMGADPVAFVTAGVAATRGRMLKAFSVRKEAKDHGGGGTDRRGPRSG